MTTSAARNSATSRSEPGRPRSWSRRTRAGLAGPPRRAPRPGLRGARRLDGRNYGRTHLAVDAVSHADHSASWTTGPTSWPASCCARGARPGDRIALLFDQAVHSYVAMLAVMKINAAYVPLDVGFPADRIAYIMSRTRARGWCCRSSHVEGQGRRASRSSRLGLLYVDSRPPTSSPGRPVPGVTRPNAASRRRPRLPDLHLGHHRQAKGRRHRAPQHLQLRPGGRRVLRHRA